MPFELVEPETLNEALALLDLEDPSVRAIAGALMLMIKSGFFSRSGSSACAGSGSLTAIRLTAEGEWRIGSMVHAASRRRRPVAGFVRWWPRSTTSALR
jgi:aerobic carbon-monoxide dehydrogenase medium subunit